jgi:hypothetical protein
MHQSEFGIELLRHLLHEGAHCVTALRKIDRKKDVMEVPHIFSPLSQSDECK